MKRALPPPLTPEALAELVRSELAQIERLVLIALSSDRSLEERRDAIAAIRGHERRLGSMTMRSPEIIAEIEVETKAEGTAPAREAQRLAKERRDQIIDDGIRAGVGKRMNVLSKSINDTLRSGGQEEASESYLYKRQACLGLSKRQQKFSV